MLSYHWLFPTLALQSTYPSPALPCITIPLPLSSPPLYCNPLTLSSPPSHCNPLTPLLPSLALQSPYPTPPLRPFKRDYTFQVVLKVNCH